MTEISKLPVHEAMTCQYTTTMETIIELIKHSDPRVRQTALKVKVFFLFVSDSLFIFISNFCKLEPFCQKTIFVWVFFGVFLFFLSFVFVFVVFLFLFFFLGGGVQ